jgi:hypothetical protein
MKAVVAEVLEVVEAVKAVEAEKAEARAARPQQFPRLVVLSVAEVSPAGMTRLGLR